MPFRKRRHETSSQSTKQKPRANAKTYYPDKHYVYAGIFGSAEIIKNLSTEEMRRGVAAGEFITVEAHNQQQLVYELNGQSLNKEDLTNPKKRRKLQKNGKAISATTSRNRLSYLNSKSIQKITDVDQAWNEAIKLIPGLPSPEKLKDSNYFYATTDLVDKLASIPTVVFNKMGFRRLGRSTPITKTGNPDEYKVRIHDIHRYTEWYMHNRLPPADERLIADQAERVREDAQPEPAAETTPFIYLPIFSLFVNSVPAKEQVNQQPEHEQAHSPLVTSASVLPEWCLQETNVAWFNLMPPDESASSFANSLPSDNVATQTSLLLDELFDLEDERPSYRM